MDSTPRVTSYASLEDMFAAMAEAEDRANAALHPRQVALRDATESPCFWVRPFDDLLIFGQTPSLPELVAVELGYVAVEDVAERALVEPQLRERRARGYLTGTCFSLVEPGGEWGDTHVASVWPLAEVDFEAARAAGWDPAHPGLRACLRAVAVDVAIAGWGRPPL